MPGPTITITGGVVWTDSLVMSHSWILFGRGFYSSGSVGEMGVISQGTGTMHTEVDFSPGGSAGAGQSVVRGVLYQNAVYGKMIAFDTKLATKRATGTIELVAWASEQAYSQGQPPLFTAKFNGKAAASVGTDIIYVLR